MFVGLPANLLQRSSPCVPLEHIHDIDREEVDQRVVELAREDVSAASPGLGQRQVSPPLKLVRKTRREVFVPLVLCAGGDLPGVLILQRLRKAFRI